MRQIYLDLSRNDIDSIKKIAYLCESYRKWFNVDFQFGRYTIDGCSIVGILSLASNIVKVCPVPNDDEKAIMSFYKKLKPFGAYFGEE